MHLRLMRYDTIEQYRWSEISKMVMGDCERFCLSRLHEIRNDGSIQSNKGIKYFSIHLVSLLPLFGTKLFNRA